MNDHHPGSFLLDGVCKGFLCQKNSHVSFQTKRVQLQLGDESKGPGFFRNPPVHQLEMTFRKLGIWIFGSDSQNISGEA